MIRRDCIRLKFSIVTHFNNISFTFNCTSFSSILQAKISSYTIKNCIWDWSVLSIYNWIWFSISINHNWAPSDTPKNLNMYSMSNKTHTNKQNEINKRHLKCDGERKIVWEREKRNTAKTTTRKKNRFWENQMNRYWRWFGWFFYFGFLLIAKAIRYCVTLWLIQCSIFPFDIWWLTHVVMFRSWAWMCQPILGK